MLGVYPSVLTDLGIKGALEAVARHAPMPVRVVAVGVTRHAAEIESAIYFTCVEDPSRTRSSTLRPRAACGSS